jgi:hypothetical protein
MDHSCGTYYLTSTRTKGGRHAKLSKTNQPASLFSLIAEGSPAGGDALRSVPVELVGLNAPDPLSVGLYPFLVTFQGSTAP